MGCFKCCEEDDVLKATDNGMYPTNHSAGNFLILHCTRRQGKEG